MGRNRLAPPIKDGDWTHLRQVISRLSTVVLGSEATPTFAGLTLGNTGLHLLDTDASHDLIIKPGSDLSADRILTLTTGDAARTITLQGNPTLDDWFDQSVKVAASPTFGGLTIFDPIPILILKDSTYAGDVSLGYIEWRDSNNTRLGFFGNASSGNDDLFWKNESSGGHIKIETTGVGEVQIFANTVINANLSCGDSVTEPTAERVLNLIDTTGVMRIWRWQADVNLHPAVELIWGTNSDETHADNYYWDFFVDASAASAGSFVIRDRTGGGNNFRLELLNAANAGDLVCGNSQIRMGTGSPGAGGDPSIMMADSSGNLDRIFQRQHSTDDVYIGDIDDNSGDIVFRAGGVSHMYLMDDTGRLGLGVSDPDTKLEVLNAGTQLKLSYDATNYVTLAVQSDGDLILDSNKASYDLDFGDGNILTTGTLASGLSTITVARPGDFIIQSWVNSGTPNYSAWIKINESGALNLFADDGELWLTPDTSNDIIFNIRTAGSVRMATDGVGSIGEAADYRPETIYAAGDIYAGSQFKSSAGTVGNPAWTFTDCPDTGIYLASTDPDVIGLATDGVLRAYLGGATGLTLADDLDLNLGGTGKVKVVGTEITDDQILMDTDKTITPIATGFRLTNSGAGEVCNFQLENDTTLGTVFQLPAGAATQVNAVPGANFDYTFFVNSENDENKTVYVYGFPDGIAKKYGSFQMVDIGGANHFQISTEDAIPISINRITKIGDGTNQTKIEADGTMVFEGTATVWNDMQFQISDAKVTPASLLPSWEAFTANTSEYAFSVNDEVDTSANEIPHWWKEGTAGNAHIHITTKAINNTEVTYAKFTVTFAYADTNEVWVESPLTAELTIANPTAALTNLYLDLGDITLTNYLAEAQMRCRVKRIPATTGTEYVGDIFITQVGIHFEQDTIGTRLEVDK